MATSSAPPTRFAELLHHHRVSKGLSREDLARHTDAHPLGGLSAKAIQALELGDRRAPRHSTVETLADALHLTGDERTQFFEEANRLRVRKSRKTHDPFATTGNLSQYLPRMSPTDATTAEVYGPPADEYLLPLPESFVGREEELRWLADHIRRGGITGITAVQGIGGIGKTSLAAKAIQELRAEGRFTGGVAVNICLDKTDHIQLICEVLSRFDPQHRLPTDTNPTQLHDIAQRLLSNKDILIVLDNVEPELDIESMIRPLQAAKATILLTSRAYIPIGQTLDLRVMTSDQAQQLFWSYYGKLSLNGITDEMAEGVARIVANLGYHTLAVKVAARYAREARRNLNILAEQLRTPNDVMKIADAVHTIFQQSFAALPPLSQHLFAAFAVFATPEFGRNAAKAIAKALGHSKPEACVDSLIERALVEPAELQGLPPGSDKERLQLHPLLHVFAREQLGLLPPEFATMARSALAEYYAEYASRPLRAELGPDEKNITEALVCAHQHSLDDLVAKICLGMQAFWRDFGRADRTETYLSWGIAAAERIASTTDTQEARLALATMRLASIRFLRLTGKLDEAEDLAKLILETFRNAENLQGIASTLTVLGNIARDKGQYEQARIYLRDALDKFQADQVRDQSGQGIAYCFLGQISQRLGNMETAECELQESLTIYRRINDQWGSGLALILLGRNAILQGDFRGALVHYHEALELHQALEARRSIGADLSSLGEIALNMGDLQEAEPYFHQSLQVRRESRDRRGEAVDFTFLGRLTSMQKRVTESTCYLQDALTIWEEVKDPRGKGWGLSEQAQLALSCDQLEEVDALLEQSLEIFRLVGDQRGEAIDLRVCAEVALKRDDLITAEKYLHQAESLAVAVKDQPEQVRILLLRGMLDARYGHHNQAESHYRESLRLASSLDMKYEIARACAALGSLFLEQRQLENGTQMLMRAATYYAHAGIPTS